MNFNRYKVVINNERHGIIMNEIMNFFKDILTMDATDKSPIGLCRFECTSDKVSKTVKTKRKREMRLSELMDK